MMDRTNRRTWLRSNAAALGLMMAGAPMPAALGAPVPQSEKRKGPLRLCYNENPYGPSPKVLQVMSERLGQGNRYALEMQSQLRGAIAKGLGITPDYVVLGSGSSEILALTTNLAARKGKGELLLAEPTFTSWLSPAAQCGLQLKPVALDAENRHDLNAMQGALNDNTRLLFICNPANPCGTTVADADLRSFVKQAAAKTVVLVDEAYCEYVDSGSVIDLVKDLPNLVVTRTFSKIYGLAGLRVGYGIAHPATVQRLSGQQGWPNTGVSHLSMAAALASLGDAGLVQESRRRNREALDFTVGVLKDLKLDYIPAQANFLMFDVERLKLDIVGAFAKRGILVRSWNLKGRQFCRVSMGTTEEMAVFAERLKEIVG